MPFRPLLTLGLAGLLLLPACQALPGPLGDGPPRMLLPLASSQALRVTIRAADRHVAALAAEVATLVVTVRAADGQEYMRALGSADFAAGDPTVTFTGLPAGGTQVQVTALGAADDALGRADRVAFLEPGAITEVAMTLRLNATSGFPAAVPTSAAIGITLVDGPVVAGPPVPSPTPMLFLGRQLLAWNDLAMVGSRLVADPQGFVWLMNPGGALLKLGPDASLLASVDAPPGATASSLAMAPQEAMWQSGAGKLHKRSRTGAALGSYTVPVQTGPDGLAVDEGGQVWLAGGRRVARVSPSGAVLDTHDLSADAGAVAVDRSSGMAWVLLPTQGRVLRFAADGTALPAVTVNQTSDTLTALAVDADGHAWVGQNWSGCVAKIAPDGRVLGQYPTGNQAGRLVIDRQGNVISGPNEHASGTMPYATKLTPDGRVLGHYVTSYIAHAAIDANDDLWVLSTSGFAGTALLKIAL